MSEVSINPATAALVGNLARLYGVDEGRIIHAAVALMHTIHQAALDGQSPALVDADGQATHMLASRSQLRDG